MNRTTALVAAGLVSAFLAALLPPVGTTAATKPWTTARVQKAILAKVRIKCPTALERKFSLAHGFGSADDITRAQARCDDPAEPRLARAIVACGVMPPGSFCDTGQGHFEFSAELLRMSQLDVLWHDHGTPVAWAMCVGRAPSFQCGIELGTARTGRPSYQGCLAVTANGKSLRWKVTSMWEYGRTSWSTCGVRFLHPGP
jgi:hypothetical protein